MSTTRMERAAAAGDLVVFAGAGVSAAPPTSLPGWDRLNRAFVTALGTSLEASIERPGWLAQSLQGLVEQRTGRRFVPEYQAQLLEEMCGERYFQGLQALDVDSPNDAHRGIAALAAARAVRAVVTTNFDRLIEKALDERGVPHCVAYDEASYADILRLTLARDTVPVVKIHGCVSDHRSMIDTLKQRRLGRSDALIAALDGLRSGYWLYLGFSAADLEGDRGYLGLLDGAPASGGATYVAWPEEPELGAGARLLVAAHGKRGEVSVAEVATVTDALSRTLGVPPLSAPSDDGESDWEDRLGRWASSLSPAACGLCLAGLFEAAGHADVALDVLHRLVRKERGRYVEEGTPEYRAMQLHYGRLGATWGQSIAVPDLAGAQSNKSVETVQSLLRLHGTEQSFVAVGWSALAYLWSNDGVQATRIGVWALQGLANGDWQGIGPRTDEDVADAWIAGAQVLLFNAHGASMELVLATADQALDRARATGDVVRAARAGSLGLVAHVECALDFEEWDARLRAEIAESERVGDAFAGGFRSYALGRLHVGVGRTALIERLGEEAVAERALEHLDAAADAFRSQGMDPWCVLVEVQRLKALADLRRLEECGALLEALLEQLDRFPVCASHVLEAQGQLRSMVGDDRANDSFAAAVESAEESGLRARAEQLRRYLDS